MAVKQQFITDDKQAQKALDNLIRKNNELAAANKKLSTEGKQGQNDFSSAVSGSVQQLAAMATGLFSVSAIVGTVIGQYRQWRDEMVKLGKDHQQVSRDIVRELTETGDLLATPELQAAFRSAQGATEQQALASFAGVSAASSGGVELSLEQRKRLALEVAKQAPTNVDLKQLGLVAGEIATLDPDRSADDVVDLATVLRATARKNIDKITNKSSLAAVNQLMQTTGMSQEEAFATSLEILNRTGRAETGAAVAAKLGADLEIKRAGRGRSLSTRDLAANRFAAETDANARLQMLFSDQEVARAVLGDEQATKLNLVDTDRIASLAEKFRGAQRDNFAQQQLDTLQDSLAGRSAQTQQLNEELADKGLKAVADTEEAAVNARQFVLDRAKEKGFWTHFAASRQSDIQYLSGAPAETTLMNALIAGSITQEEFGEYSNTAGAYEGRQANAASPEAGGADKIVKAIKDNQRNPNVNTHVEN